MQWQSYSDLCHNYYFVTCQWLGTGQCHPYLSTDVWSPIKEFTGMSTDERTESLLQRGMDEERGPLYILTFWVSTMLSSKSRTSTFLEHLGPAQVADWPAWTASYRGSNGVSLFFIQSLLFYREGLRLREPGASNDCPISSGCQVSCGQRKTQLPFFSALIKLLLSPSCVLWVADSAGGLYNSNVLQSWSSFICYQIQDPLILKGKRLGAIGWARGEHFGVSSQPTDEMCRVNNRKSRWKTIPVAHTALSLWPLLCV